MRTWRKYLGDEAIGNRKYQVRVCALALKKYVVRHPRTDKSPNVASDVERRRQDALKTERPARRRPRRLARSRHAPPQAEAEADPPHRDAGDRRRVRRRRRGRGRVSSRRRRQDARARQSRRERAVRPRARASGAFYTNVFRPSLGFNT
eukprot:31522-Pelagococcus_subviridis.AAC.9